MFVFWWSATLGSRLLIEGYVYRALESEAKSIVSTLEEPNGNQLKFSLGQYKLNPAYSRPASGQYFIVQFDDHHLASRSSWDQLFDIELIAPGQSQKRRSAGLAGEPLLMWLGGYQRSGQKFTVMVASDVTPIQDRLNIFQWFAALIAFALLAATLGVQRWIVRGSVQKLNAIRSDMLKLEHGRATVQERRWKSRPFLKRSAELAAALG